jgi:hypothetical protein
MKTVPSSIDAIIKLTKGELLNRDIEAARHVQVPYITQRALTRIYDFINTNNRSAKEITFFFNKSEIIRIIEKEAPVEWKRDLKIKTILEK